MSSPLTRAHAQNEAPRRHRRQVVAVRVPIRSHGFDHVDVVELLRRIELGLLFQLGLFFPHGVAEATQAAPSAPDQRGLTPALEEQPWWLEQQRPLRPPFPLQVELHGAAACTGSVPPGQHSNR